MRAAGGGAAAAGRGGGAGRRQHARNRATVVLHHSMVRLPEKPMMPRLFDERVGYFTTAQEITRRTIPRAQRALHRALASGKEGPHAAVSDP